MTVLMDTCSATFRHRSRLYICTEVMNHDGEHVDGKFTWPTSAPLAYVGERIFDVRRTLPRID